MAQLPVSAVGEKKAPQRVTWLGPLIRRVIFYALFLVVWYLVAHSTLVKSYLFADPIEVWTTLVEGFFRNGVFLTAILTSLSRLAIGYGISVVLGLVLGLAIGLNRYVEETLGSLVLGFQTLPSVCWTPFALLWFGLSEQAMIFVVVMGALFSITLGVDAGVKNAPPVYIKAARNMGARGFALIGQVVLPAALPTMISGLKQGWSFAWRSLMAAEIIYITVSLGGLLEGGRTNADPPTMFAVMFIIIVLGMAINALIFDPLERAVRRRWGLQR